MVALLATATDPLAELFREEGHVVLVGDVLEMLRRIPSNSVQCVVTSPPYLALRDYGLPASVWGGDPGCEHEWGEPQRVANYNWQERSAEAWAGGHQRSVMAQRSAFCVRCDAWNGCLGQEPTVELFIAHLVLIFEEVKRVLRPDGVLFVNIGDSYAGSGKGPTGHNGIGDQEKRQGFTGEGPKRAVGPADGTILSATGRRKGRGIRDGAGYELRDTTVMPGFKPKDLMLVPERFAIAMQAAGWWVRSRIVWKKLSAMPESVSDRPRAVWEHIWMFTKSRRYFWDNLAVRQPQRRGVGTHKGGGSNGKRGNLDASGKVASGGWALSTPVRIVDPAGAHLPNVWDIGPEPSSYEYCCRCDSFFLGPERKLIVKRTESNGEKVRICPVCGGPGDWVDHFAAFVSEVPRRCILAATSEKGACRTCGAPWRRIVARAQPDRAVPPARNQRDGGLTVMQGLDRTGMSHQKYSDYLEEHPPETVGWEPTCRCDRIGRSNVRLLTNPVPCVVLDIFLGSGTTSRAAKALGRRSIGIELSERYAALARRRTERDVPKWARPSKAARPRPSVVRQMQAPLFGA